MIQISDNFGYQGPKPNFERDYYATLAKMKAVTDSVIDNGHWGYCGENGKFYVYNYSNSSDATTGKWREYKPIDTALSTTSTNTVQNKVVKTAIDDLISKYNDIKKGLDGIVIDSALSDDSTNAVQNKVIKAELTSIGTLITQLQNDSNSLKTRMDKVEPVDTALSTTSEKPVQNKVINSAISNINTQLTALKTRLDKVEPVDTALSETSEKPLQNKVIAAKFKAIDSEIGNINDALEGLKYFASFTYCVAGWTENDLKPTADEQYGDPDLLRSWDFYLVDHNGTLAEEGTKLVPEAKLQRNNILRKEDGSFAKTIFTNLNCKGLYDFEEDNGTTTIKSVFNNSANLLYTNATCTGESYSTAGNFDPEKFYKEEGKTAKLYFKDSNTKIHELRDIPRPWEEYQQEGKGFDKLRSVVLSYPKKVYLVDQVKGKSGKIWKGVFFEPAVWDGIDVTKYPLDTTGIFPSPATSVTMNSVQKMFCRYVDCYLPGSTGLTMSANCQGHLGEGGISSCFTSDDITVDGTAYKRFIYGRSYDVSQLTNCTWARNNNADVQKPYPFAEGGYHSRNTFVSAMECLYQTKYLNASNFFASGISANDGVSNEAQWKQYGGIRWHKAGVTTWSYGTWNTTPADICYNASGEKTHFNALLSWWFPKEQVLESQTAASYAVEMEVAEGVEYEFGGKTWWYKNVPGAPGLNDGEMNCIIYKKIPYTMQAYDVDGNKVNFDLEIILRMSLMNGYNHSGDYWIYYGGGYEQVGTVTNAENGTTGNPVVIWTAFDQTKWRSQSELQTVSLNNLGTFIFENDPNYWKAWEGVNLGDSYTAVRPSYTAYKSKAGGSLGTGECFWSYTAKHWSTTLNQRIRVGVGFKIRVIYLDLVGIRNGGHDSEWKDVGRWRYDVGGSGQVLLKLD